jgi:D-alanine-D-alanine ligase
MRHARIGVLMGGASREREISLRTGGAVCAALRKKRYRVTAIDVTRAIAQTLREKKITAAFIALHGRGGEDGTIQGMLELMGIPYTGSGVLASALAMHKGMTKHLLRRHGIPTADFQVISAAGTVRARLLRSIRLPLPLVIKPVAEGSSIGTTIVKHRKNLGEACRTAALYDRQILVERFIEGREITAGIVNGRALPLIEIVPRQGLYDFTAKYTPGHTTYIPAPRMKKRTAQLIRDVSLETYHALGCEGAARVDLMLDHRTDEPFVLEINTVPGMTATSLLPLAARHAGLSFAALVERIMLSARLKEMNPACAGSPAIA